MFRSAGMEGALGIISPCTTYYRIVRVESLFQFMLKMPTKHVEKVSPRMIKIAESKRLTVRKRVPGKPGAAAALLRLK